MLSAEDTTGLAGRIFLPMRRWVRRDPHRRLFLFRQRAAAVLAAFTALSGCYRPPPATAPLATLRLGGPAAESRTLVIFLPGRGDSPENFDRHGFARAVRERGLPVDLLAVDAHLGYYLNGTVIERLETDVIAPARARGYRRIWLVGISIGGLGSLLYLRAHPGVVSGVVLLAPYLGERDVTDEIAAAGGLGRWQPVDLPSDRFHPRQLWRWLQETYAGLSAPSATPLYLGYGTRDRFVAGDRLLAAVLPPERVFTTPGGHRWDPWRRLWDTFLRTGALK